MINAHRIPVRRCLAAGFAMLFACSAYAFSTGPDDGHTNAPGEANCTSCHNSFPLNSGSGMLSLAGLPAQYTPGELYDLTLTLSDPVAMRWGFQLTILGGGGASVGAITVTDGGTQSSQTGSRVYLKHNILGTAPGTAGSKSWNLRWTAPAAGTGVATLYVAGNAANNDNTNLGDRIYATSFASLEGAGVPVGDLPQALTLLGAAPNPFNPATEIRFNLARAGHVRLDVFALNGRRVATVADRVFGEGGQAVTWDGRDHTGRTLESGTYVYILESGDERRSARMTLVK